MGCKIWVTKNNVLFHMPQVKKCRVTFPNMEGVSGTPKNIYSYRLRSEIAKTGMIGGRGKNIKSSPVT